jgi:hypothetical protein
MTCSPAPTATIIAPRVTSVSTLATTTTTTLDNITNKKIENVTEGLPRSCYNCLSNRVLPGLTGKQNVLTICDYISSMRSEINASNNYRKDIMVLLCNLSIFFKNAKLFKEITREDLLLFLDSHRKIESVDPLHKWIGTYNTYRMQLMRFFKWLYLPDIEPARRPKPSVIENIPQLKRKEKSTYKPTDIWTAEDDSLFLKY